MVRGVNSLSKYNYFRLYLGTLTNLTHKKPTNETASTLSAFTEGGIGAVGRSKSRQGAGGRHRKALTNKGRYAIVATLYAVTQFYEDKQII